MEAYMGNTTDLLKTLGVTRKTGLTDEAAAQSRKTHGENAFERKKPDSLTKRIFEAASEPMIVMLFMAAFITLAVNVSRSFTGGEGNYFECAGIFAAISLSVLITVAMEGKSAKAFDALNRIGEDAKVRGIRNGQVRLIPRREIAVGDILLAGAGDKLLADGRLLECASLCVDESALTGESMPVSKDAAANFTRADIPVAEHTNMLFAGSYVFGGSGVFVVTGVGNGTEFGKIARELSSVTKSTTPLQEKMARLGKKITALGTAAAAVVFAAQLAIFLLNGTATLENISGAFITSIVLIVAAVPEGLPTIVAVSLSINIIKMSRNNALVRKLIACETIGGVNVICTDKTGTLTENLMTVTDVHTGGATVKPEDVRDKRLLRNFCVNSTADICADEGHQEAPFIGNPTECALLVAAQKAGLSYTNLRACTAVTRVQPFSSEEKAMTTETMEDGEPIAYIKGSPEKILAACGLSPSQKREIERQIGTFQEKACRVIAFAHQKLGRTDGGGAVFDGFAAISDPLRADVREAVQRCRDAGIEVKMLTGDNILTARAIADELHLSGDDKQTAEGSEIEAMSDEELALALPRIAVIARSTPIVKMRVVNALKALGNVVAATGDGINDAPALKNADVGIAMGVSGTEVSKEASDIVLLDDSFSSIVKAVQWGRGIYENFQRFLQFQLTVNLSSVIVVLSSILLGYVSPFSALQLLWINIVMDGPPALILGLEAAGADLMKRKPIKRDAEIVTRGMLARIAVNASFISCVFLAQQSFNFLGGAQEEMPTILFTLFVLFQLFNAFNCRELTYASALRDFSGNRLMPLVFFAVFCLQVLITQFGGSFYATVPLSAGIWCRMIAVSFTIVAASEAFRMLMRTISRTDSRKCQATSACSS